jgi:protocatechuate 3,4-dioxygenase beta subunit
MMRETRTLWKFTRWLYPALAALLLAAPSGAQAKGCTPTPWDEIGPFYRPNAPLRGSIGSGYLLSGTVRSARDCSPIAKARVEVWQTAPNGRYDEAHRATLISDAQGRYRLQTDFPGGYAQRPGHIHILVDAAGFQGLVTQHYPRKGARQAVFDLVLETEAPKGTRPGDRVKDLVAPARKR